MDKNEILNKQISGSSKEHLCQYVGDIWCKDDKTFASQTIFPKAFGGCSLGGSSKEQNIKCLDFHIFS